MKKKLVLFDFDGTITTSDTLLKLIKFYRGRIQYFTGLIKLSPILLLYLSGVLKNWKAKQIFLTQYLKDEDVDKFNQRCRDFAEKVIPKLVRPKALETIRQYQSGGHTVVVVSASAENWVKPWCDVHGLHCLGTTLEVKENLITGKIKGKNCYGEEKCRRIQEAFNLSDYDEIIAYGDTSGDKEMLALAHQKHYKPFRG